MPQIDKKYLVLNGSTLKIIAMVTMLIDHIGAAILLYLPTYGYISAAGYGNWYSVYTVFRGIGRTAFPIFCFLLVEGFFHTKNVKKYALNLLGFAIISEPLFDFAFKDKFTWSGQNVFWTLLIGLGTIYCLDRLIKYFRGEEIDFGKLKNQILAAVGMVGTVIIGGGLSILMQTDYSYHGILLIVIFYLLRYTRALAGLIGYISLFFLEPLCLPGFLLIQFYNGKRGLTKYSKNLKYIFYAFYPAHLLLLFGIRCILKFLAPT